MLPSPKKSASTHEKMLANAAKAEARKLVPQQMGFWPDDRRAIANELARSALFQCRDNRKKREFYDNVALFMLGEGALTYKGEELRERDEDIWVTLTHYARDMEAGKLVVSISSSEICKQNKWRQDQRYYNEIYKSIQRMKGGVITVFSRRLAKTIKYEKALQARASDTELAKLYEEIEKYERRVAEGLNIDLNDPDGMGGMMMSLIGGETTFTGSTGLDADNVPQGNLQWDIVLDRKMVSLFAKAYLTLVDHETRQSLTATGKRLQTYFLSHKKPYPVNLRNLEKMLGLNFGKLPALKLYITEQLKQLQAHGVIHDFSFEKNADKTDWKVTVHREDPSKRDDARK